MGVSLTELEKVVQSLAEAIQFYDQSQIESQKRAFRDAAIQRFEFSIELSWKTAMKVLGSTTAAAKNAIREMARNDLIDQPEIWLGFIDGRNETSHFYDEDVAKRVYGVVLLFLPYAQDLIRHLKNPSS